MVILFQLFDKKFTVLFFYVRQEGYNAKLTKAFSLCWQQVIWSFTHKKILSLIIPAVMSAVFLFRQNLQIKQTLNQDSTGGMIENVFRKKNAKRVDLLMFEMFCCIHTPTDSKLICPT